MDIPLTPLRFKQRAAQLYGKKTGVVCGELRFTYAEFSDRCDRLAGALQSIGVPQGSRVAFLSGNCHRLLEAYYGVVQMGGVLLPLNVRLSADELAFILNDSEAWTLFYESDFHPVVEKMRSRLSKVQQFIPLDRAVDDGWSSRETYEDLLARAENFTPVAVHENDTAEIFYTSGTTADPRGVVLTHRNLYLHALSTIIALGIRDTDVQLHAIPLFHVNGWGAPQSLTCMGGTHVMMRRFDPLRVLLLISEEGVTYSSFVPSMAHALLGQPGVSGFDYSSLRMLFLGGAASSPELVRRIEAVFKCRCHTGYGLTESSPILTIALPKSTVHDADDLERTMRQATPGYPLVGVEIDIVDEQGNRLPHDGKSTGEIVARSDGVMKGYWNRPRESADALQDGWLHTGDVGSIDEEGCLRIVDRKKDIIISGGENIASLEIEQRLYHHDAVLECAVIGVPDPRWGEVPKAFVVLRQGCSVTEQELLAFCAQTLPSFKRPASIVFLDALPKGGTGKILKRELRRSPVG